MKKILLFIFITVLMSGCGINEMSYFSKTSNYNNITSKSNYTVEHMGNKVNKVIMTYEYNDKTNDNDEGKVIDGKVVEVLDDVVNNITDGILDIAGIKTRHNTKFGSYVNKDGFKTKIDLDSGNDYKVTYIYDLKKLSDTDISNFGLSKEYDVLKNKYLNNGFKLK